MSGKQKPASQRGKTASEHAKLTKLASAEAAGTENSDEEMTLSTSVLKSELEKNRAAIMSEIQASLSPINLSLDAVCKKLEAYEPRITDMEMCLSDHSDRLNRLEKQVDKLQSYNKELLEKTEDLENRSRRNNLRIIGLPEGCEGRVATAFMSKFFVDLLQDDSFTDPPELDRAHRALRAKPAEGERPRTIIVRFLRFQQKEQVVAIARKKGQLVYQGQRIFIFPDLSNTLAKKRATFNSVKSKLHQKAVKFSLRYPAVLCVTHQQVEHKFNNAEDAERFFNQHLASDV